MARPDGAAAALPAENSIAANKTTLVSKRRRRRPEDEDSTPLAVNPAAEAAVLVTNWLSIECTMRCLISVVQLRDTVTGLDRAGW